MSPLHGPPAELEESPLPAIADDADDGDCGAAAVKPTRKRLNAKKKRPTRAVRKSSTPAAAAAAPSRPMTLRAILPLLLCVLLFGAAASAHAQTPIPVFAGVPLVAQADHDGVNVVGVSGAGYRLYVDNVKLGADIPPSGRSAAGVVTFPIALLMPGTHAIVFAAFNVDGEARSAALIVQASIPPAPPNPPTNIRISAAPVP